jgi:hypothetical protein
MASAAAWMAVSSCVAVAACGCLFGWTWRSLAQFCCEIIRPALCTHSRLTVCPRYVATSRALHVRMEIRAHHMVVAGTMIWPTLTCHLCCGGIATMHMYKLPPQVDLSDDYVLFMMFADGSWEDDMTPIEFEGDNGSASQLTMNEKEFHEFVGILKDPEEEPRSGGSARK